MAIEQAEQPTVDRLFSDLIRALSDRPQDVSIRIEQHSSGTKVIRVDALPSDLGKIIGLGGRSARALRLLLAAIASARGERWLLDIDVGE